MRRRILWVLMLVIAGGALWVAAQDDDTSQMSDLLPLNEDVRYEVGVGDTLDDIAATFDVGLACLLETNGFAEGESDIFVGDILVIRVACPPYAGLNYVPFPRPAAVEQGGGGESTYTVRTGDTLSDIALAYNISEASLQEYNDLENPNEIFVGQILQIPPDAPAFGQVPPLDGSVIEQGGAEGDIIYVIQPGDTLDVIGAFYNAAPACIAETNNIENAGRIQPRETIVISETCAPYEGSNIVGGRILPFEPTADENATAAPTTVITVTPVPTLTPTATLPGVDAPQQTAVPAETGEAVTEIPATPTPEVLDVDEPGNLLEELGDLDVGGN
jgi:LysM repeat protein